MSNGARIGAVGATVLVLVLAFGLLSPEADDDSNIAQTPTTAPANGTTPPPSADHERAPDAEPAPTAPTFARVRVQGGKPVGGVRTVTVSKGERVRLQVSSTNTTDEIHVHGYDLTRAMTAGDAVLFSFVATAEGIFEIELEGRHTQIAELVVEP